MASLARLEIAIFLGALHRDEGGGTLPLEGCSAQPIWKRPAATVLMQRVFDKLPFMKQIFLTLLTTVLAIALTLLAVAAGTAVCLSVTSWGKALSGRTAMPAHPWEAVSSAYFSLLLFVFLPIVVITSFLVGKFAKRLPVIAAVIAILPVSLIASGFRLEAIWVTTILVILGISIGYVGATRFRPKEVH